MMHRRCPPAGAGFAPGLGANKRGGKGGKKEKGNADRLVGGLRKERKEQGYRTIILKDGDTVANRVLTAAVKCT
jgi:hypothetical protein